MWVQLLGRSESNEFFVLRQHTRGYHSMLKSKLSHTTKSEESKRFEVYVIESDDGYWYVGGTTRTTPVRFAEHLARSSDTPIGKLAKKGVKFRWSVLEEGVGTLRDRIEAEQRWYEDKLYTHGGGRTLNRMPPAGGDPFWMEGAKVLLNTDFGKALARAAILEMAQSLLRRSGYVRPPAMDSSLIGSCTSPEEVAEA